MIAIERKAMGAALQVLREQRGLTLREAGTLANIDHAYISRLEKGEKHRMSPVLLARLIRTLRCSARDQQIVAWLVNHPGIDAGLVRYVLGHPEIDFEVFAMAACLPYPKNVRAEAVYPNQIAMAKHARKAMNPGGELSTWCVYDKPDDFPAKIVVREWVGLASKQEANLFDTLDEAHRFLQRRGLVRLARPSTDAAKIVEVWL